MRIFTLSHSPSVPASSAGPHAAAPSPTRHARTMYNPIPTLIIAVDENDVERCSVAAFRIVAARHTDDILSQIGRWRPAALVVDADWPHLDLVAVCGAAHRIHGAGVLVTMASPQAAPSALHAGCDAILLRPFARNLLAARIGRLARELPCDPKLAGRLGGVGTSRRWPHLRCRQCETAGVVSFDHASHRRDWYACLSCEAVWVARRVE